MKNPLTSNSKFQSKPYLHIFQIHPILVMEGQFD